MAQPQLSHKPAGTGAVKSGKLSFQLRVPTFEGRSTDAGTLTRFMAAIEDGLFDLEKEELAHLHSKLEPMLSRERSWRLIAGGTYHELENHYRGRRFQIIKAADQFIDGKRVLVLDLAITAAVFSVLQEALCAANAMNRASEVRKLLLEAAEQSYASTARKLRDKFMEVPELFHVDCKIEASEVILTAKVAKPDDILPTMEEALDDLRSSAPQPGRLFSRMSLTFF